MYLRMFGAAGALQSGVVVTLVFALVVASTMVLMVAWALICIYRVCFPSEPNSVVRESVRKRLQLTKRGKTVPVSIHEIQEDQRYLNKHQHEAEYVYEQGTFANVPPVWWEDLKRRQN